MYSTVSSLDEKAAVSDVKMIMKTFPFCPMFGLAMWCLFQPHATCSLGTCG